MGKDSTRRIVAFLLNGILLSTTWAEIVQVETAREDDAKPCTFPRHFSAKILGHAHASVSLLLKRNDVIQASREVVLMFSNEDGESSYEKHKVSQRLAAYHSYESNAAFVLHCRLHKDSGEHFYALEGSFFRQGRKFVLTPTAGDTSVAMTTNTITVPHGMTEKHEFNGPGDHGFVAKESQHCTSGHSHHQRDDGTKPTTRLRRATTEYFIDVLPVIDYGLYQSWLSKNGNNAAQALTAISTYLANLFTSINMRLSTLSLQNSVSLKLSGLSPHLSTSPAASPFSEQPKEAMATGQFRVDASRLLEKFKGWVASTNSLPAHDHAMLLSSLVFYGGTDNGKGFNITKGLAYVGTICQPGGDSTSVVEDTGTYQSEAVAAHEIGHSLGSLHDGQDNPCKPGDRYVMSDGTYSWKAGNDGNPWAFSSCSSDAISTKLSELAGTGLLNSCLKSRSGQVPNSVTSKNINDQCTSFYGPKSFVCRGTEFLPLSKLCDVFYCHNPGTGKCDRFNTAAGTCCGNGKHCANGQCISAPQSGCTIDESCPLGDQPGVVTVDGKTCAEIHSSLCYNNNINIKCCATCKTREIGKTGCKYGDKQPGCVAGSCGGKLPSGLNYDVICCETCVKTCVNRANIKRDGKTYPCSQYIDLYGISECYSSSLHDNLCCESCEERRTDNKDCPFGDNLSIFSCKSIYQFGRKCTAQEERYCCETCPAIANARAEITTQTPTEEPKPTKDNSNTGGNTSTGGDTNTGGNVTDKGKDCKPGSTCDTAVALRRVDWIPLMLVTACSFLASWRMNM